jgi:hypothetical protein
MHVVLKLCEVDDGMYHTLLSQSYGMVKMVFRARSRQEASAMSS